MEPNHFVPIITVSQARYTQVEPVIYPLPGTRFRDTTTRTTPSLGFAEHVIGRTGEITAEGLEELGQPYLEGDLVGLTGIEAAYETQLAGTPSGDIQLTDCEGEVVEVLDRIEGRSHARGDHARPNQAGAPSRHFPPPTGRPAPSWSTARATCEPWRRGPGRVQPGASRAGTRRARRSRW